MAKCLITGEEIAEGLEGDTLHVVVTDAGAGVAVRFTKDHAHVANAAVSKRGAALALRAAADKIDPPAAEKTGKKQP